MNAVDKHPQRQEIIDAILAGESVWILPRLPSRAEIEKAARHYERICASDFQASVERTCKVWNSAKQTRF